VRSWRQHWREVLARRLAARLLLDERPGLFEGGRQVLLDQEGLGEGLTFPAAQQTHFARSRVEKQPSRPGFCSGPANWFSHACRATGSVKESMVACSQLWRRSDHALVSEPRRRPRRIQHRHLNQRRRGSRGKPAGPTKATTAVAAARPNTQRHFHNAPNASPAVALSGAGCPNVSRTLVCRRPRT